MSIAALVIALSLLVDNAIVVAESVQAGLNAGMPGDQAAKQAVGGLALPLPAANGTTLAAFIPMQLAVGNVGDFTRAIPTVIMLTLSVSYFYAVTVTPFLAARFLRAKKKKHNRPTRKRLTGFLCHLSTRYPVMVSIGTLLLLVMSGIGAGFIEAILPPG
ncbi:MAG: efflux RND transporter permease subunit [Acidobacteriota bacterium]|nr:efflux RND transporter permease subunit [Acidobacteriota bacterium]